MKIIIFLFLTLSVYGQNEKEQLILEKEISKAAILRLNKFREIENTSREILKNIILFKYETLKVKNSESTETYRKSASFATQIYTSGNEIIDYIDEIKPTFTSEEDYLITNDSLLYDDFVKQKYAVLKIKIDNFYKQNKIITSSSKVFVNLKKLNEKNFDTNKDLLNNENKNVDHLTFNFNFKTNIGLITSLEKIQFEIICFQYMFMNTIIG